MISSSSRHTRLYISIYIQNVLFFAKKKKGTNESNYADGFYNSTGEWLEVILGGIDNRNIFGMSGAWAYTFTLSTNSRVDVSFDYELLFAPNYESNEFGQVIVTVDDLEERVVKSLTGDGFDGLFNPFDGMNGTAQETWFNIPAGTHTLYIGGFNNKKTFNNEVTRVLILQASLSVTPIAVNVNIACTMGANTGTTTNCGSFSPPPTNQCGTNILEAFFLFDGGSCDDSSNTQISDTCMEQQGSSFPLLPSNATLFVSCTNPTLTNNNVLLVTDRNGNTFGQTIQLGNEFLLTNPGPVIDVPNPTPRLPLPERVQCNIMFFQQQPFAYGMQTISFSSTELRFGETFGSLQLLDCDDLDCPPGTNDTAEFIIEIENIGNTDLNITMANFTLQDTQLNLIPQLPSGTILPVGDSQTLTLIVKIDLCIPGTFNATVTVETVAVSPPNVLTAIDTTTTQVIVAPVPALT